jgi:YidC/Oxa1 family membrane protein insertase
MSVPLLDDVVAVAYPVVFHLAQATGPAAAIVLATVAIRLLLLPLTLAATRSERAGALVLLQAPFFLVAYRLFLSPTIGGHANVLLHSALFGAPLSTHLLGGHALVFLPLLAALAGLAWLAVRRTRRLAGPDAPRGPLALLPYGTLLSAAVIPLAAVLYLVTTTAWTAVENAVLRRPR